MYLEAAGDSDDGTTYYRDMLATLKSWRHGA
jgi:hypothetical protein